MTTSAAPHRETRRGGMSLALLALGAILGLLASVALGPHAPSMEGTSGDPELAARTASLLGDRRGYQALAVVEITEGRARFAGLGSPDAAHGAVTPTTPLQLGSITKTFNGLLLADAVRRGEVRLDQPVGELLPELAGSPAGSATLQELAQHRAGMPVMLPSEQPLMLPMQISGRNPFTSDEHEVLTEVRGLPRGQRGQFAYSNVSASVLGHALARRAGATDWPAYVRERLFLPLGMTATTIAPTRADLPADRVAGRRENGRPLEPWTSPGMAPAGFTTWTTPQDMATYAAALLGGRAPGMAALDPSVENKPGDRIGLHWFELDYKGHRLTWHNGSTQGGSTMLVLDRQAQRAAMVFSTTGRGPETLARQLVTDGTVKETSKITEPAALIGFVVFAAWLVWLGVVAYAAIRGRTLAGLVAAILEFIALAVLVAPMGPWHWVGGPVFGLGCGLAAGLMVVGVRRGLPWLGGSPVLGWSRLVTAAVFCAAILGVRLFLP